MHTQEVTSVMGRDRRLRYSVDDRAGLGRQGKVGALDGFAKQGSAARASVHLRRVRRQTMPLSRLLITVSTVTAFALLPEGNSTKAASKPSLTAKDIENMMTSLSNWGRWGKQDE